MDAISTLKRQNTELARAVSEKDLKILDAELELAKVIKVHG